MFCFLVLLGAQNVSASNVSLRLPPSSLQGPRSRQIHKVRIPSRNTKTLHRHTDSVRFRLRKRHDVCVCVSMLLPEQGAEVRHPEVCRGPEAGGECVCVCVHVH